MQNCSCLTTWWLLCFSGYSQHIGFSSTCSHCVSTFRSFLHLRSDICSSLSSSKQKWQWRWISYVRVSILFTWWVHSSLSITGLFNRLTIRVVHHFLASCSPTDLFATDFSPPLFQSRLFRDEIFTGFGSEIGDLGNGQLEKCHLVKNDLEMAAVKIRWRKGPLVNCRLGNVGIPTVRDGRLGRLAGNFSSQLAWYGKNTCLVGWIPESRIWLTHPRCR